MTVNNKSEIKKQALAAAGSPESVSMNALSVVLLGANQDRRRTLAAALAETQAHVVRESALPGIDSLPQLLKGECDVLIVDLDQNNERGLDLVEAVRSFSSAITVMVYSCDADRELLVRCMQAGAREFLSDPLAPGAVTEALVRASVRREELGRPKKSGASAWCLWGQKAARA